MVPNSLWMTRLFFISLLLAFVGCSLKVKTHEGKVEETPLIETLFFRSLLASIGHDLTKLDQLKEQLAKRGTYIQQVDEEQGDQFRTATKKKDRDVDLTVGQGKYSILTTFDRVLEAVGDSRKFNLWLNILNGTFLAEEQVSKFVRGLGHDRFEESFFHYLPHVDERMFAEWVRGLVDERAGPLAFKWLFRIVPRDKIVSLECLGIFAEAPSSMIDPQTASLIFRHLSYIPTTEEINSIIALGTAPPALISELLIRINPDRQTMAGLVQGGYQKQYEETVSYDRRRRFYDVEFLASRKWGTLKFLGHLN